jgi:hypothetical protein
MWYRHYSCLWHIMRKDVSRPTARALGPSIQAMTTKTVHKENANQTLVFNGTVDPRDA